MSSAIQPAIHQFIAIATAALPATNPNDATQVTQVHFGKPLPRYIASITLQISGVRGDQDPAELGPTYRREEKFNIMCSLTTWAGDNNYLQRMDDCFAFFSDITVAVANNPSLNNTVRFAQPKSLGFTPDADAEGKSMGILTFMIACEARITSLT